MPKRINKEIESKIIKDYKNGKGTNFLAKKFNLHRATIQRTLIRNGLKLRKTSPYIGTYNVNFFSSFTRKSSYWAGFILADGCVRSDRDAIDIGLQKSDSDHLEKLAKATSFNGNICFGKELNCAKIDFAGKWFPESLKNNFGIGPRKSKTVRFPEKLPKKYYSDFVRGVFDGDGCISRPACPSVSFVGSIDLMLFLRELFYELGVRLKGKNKYCAITKHENYACIAITGKNAKKFLDWMYLDSKKSIRMDRKYERYINYFASKN